MEKRKIQNQISEFSQFNEEDQKFMEYEQQVEKELYDQLQK